MSEHDAISIAKSLEEISAALRGILQVLSQPQAAQPAAPSPANAANSLQPFRAETLAVENRDGQLITKFKNSVYPTYGVRVYPEILAELGIDVPSAEGDYELDPALELHLVLSSDGKPRKVVP